MKTKTVIVDYPFYNIVSNGGLSSSGIGEGRVIPVIIIDTQGNKAVDEVIQLHKMGGPPGDTKLQWSLPKTFFSPKSVYLNLEFIRPMKIVFGIKFDIYSQHTLIDGIIHSRATYLISGKAGDKVSSSIRNGVLIEVPNLDFDKKWNDILNSTIKKKYKEMGIPKRQINNSVNEHIKTMRDIWKIRHTDSE